MFGLSVPEPPELRGPGKKLPQLSPDDQAFVETMKRAGSKGFNEGNLQLLDNFLLQYPTYADAYYWRGVAKACEMRPQDLSGAKADLENTLKMKEAGASIFDEKQTISVLGKIAVANGDIATALDLLEKAMRMDLNNADNMFDITGTVPERTSSFCTWNLADLDQLTAKHPHDWRPLALKGLYFQFFTTFDESYYPQATAAFQKAALVNPTNAIIPYLLGELRMKSAYWTKKAWSSGTARDDFYRAALPFYSKAIQLDRHFERAYLERAEVYFELKQDALAIKDFDAALSINPDEASAYSDRGNTYFDMHQYYPAISDFGMAISLKGDGNIYLTNLYENRGDAYVAVQDERRAIEDYSSAIKSHLENDAILLSLGEFRNLYPEYAGASDAVILNKLNQQFAPEFQPDVFENMISGNKDKTFFDILIGDVYKKRGETYLRFGNYKSGILDFQRIIKGIPDSGDLIDRWQPIGIFGNGEKFYLDVKSSEILSSRNPRIWVKGISEKQSEVMAFEVDCSTHRSRITSNVLYDSKNQVIGGSSVGDAWSEITPDTLGERIWNGVCGSQI
jgi:tetratricopeptide (TPR) repeat protein